MAHQEKIVCVWRTENEEQLLWFRGFVVVWVIFFWGGGGDKSYFICMQSFDLD